MKPIPFNLERCIAGDEVVTRDGQDYVFGAYNEKFKSMVGWVSCVAVEHTASGQGGYCQDRKLDLFMKPQKITRWIYVEPSLCFLTKDDALSSADRWYPKNSALIKIEYYEGENLG